MCGGFEIKEKKYISSEKHSVLSTPFSQVGNSRHVSFSPYSTVCYQVTEKADVTEEIEEPIV